MRARLALLPSLGLLVGCTGSPGASGGCPGPSCPADGSAGGDRADAGPGPGPDATAGDALSAVPGLLADYEFDQTKGSVAVDSSGNFRNAGLFGSMSWGTGHGSPGDASFGGGYLLLPPGIMDQAHELTFSAWVKLRTNDRAWQRIFDFGTGTGSYLFLTPRSTDNTLRFAITTYGVDAEQKLDAPSLPIGTWKHVAVVLGASGGTMFVDGQAVASGAMVTVRPADIAPIADNWLGRSHYTADPALDGEMDGVRIYSRALSAAEIMALFSGP